MTFNIRNQHAHLINNVAGNQSISGGQYGSVGALDDARDAVRALREALATTPLDGASAAAAQRELDEVDAELGKPEPDRPTVAHALSRLVDVVSRAASVGTAVTAIVAPLGPLVSWLGVHGEPIARVLGHLL